MNVTRIIAAITISGGGFLLLASTVNAMKKMPQTMQDKMKRLAQAIAKAEGFYVSGSIAQRANNPGNLKSPGFTYAGQTGTLQEKATFGTLGDGWNALYRQIDLIATGKSKVYRPDMTFAQIAQLYTGGDNPVAWAKIVTNEIGVTPETIFVNWWLQ